MSPPPPNPKKKDYVIVEKVFKNKEFFIKMIGERGRVQGSAFKIQPICCKSPGTTYSFSSSLLIVVHNLSFRVIHLFKLTIQ